VLALNWWPKSLLPVFVLPVYGPQAVSNLILIYTFFVTAKDANSRLCNQITPSVVAYNEVLRLAESNKEGKWHYFLAHTGWWEVWREEILKAVSTRSMPRG